MSFIINPYRFDSVYNSTKSLSFDGTNEYVDCGDVLNFDEDEAFSFSFWVNGAYTSTGTVISTTKNDATNRGYAVSVRSDKKIQLTLRNNTVGDVALKVRSSTPLLTTNDWFNIVITYDGTNSPSGVTIYINNTSATNTTVRNSLTGTIVTNSIFAIGASAEGSAGFFDGNIDEVGVWDKELSAAEVTEIYNSGCPKDLSSHSAYSNCVSWWKMGEGDTISSITDQKGSNDGTPQNMDSSNITNTTPC